MTLVELTIAMALFSLVMGIFIPTLSTIQKAFEKQSDRSLTNDSARLAAEELDKEIRSGNLLYDPAAEVLDPTNGIYPGMSLRVYTQTNADTRDQGNRCVQWRILGGALQRRDWTTTWQTDGKISAWRLIADHIVNQPSPPTPPITPAFRLDPDPAKGGRTIIVTLQLQQNAVSGRVVTIQESVTGRNTEYGFPSQICSLIPPY
jgi:type II secretory pathway pseudopilin PulG